MEKLNEAKRLLTSLKSRSKSKWLGSLCAFALMGVTGLAVEHDVRVVDHEFDPPIITIAPGDSVKWTAFGNDHTVTADDDSFNSATSMPEPAIPLFGSFTVQFNTAGVYKYYCQVHGGPGGIGMAGEVRVVMPGQNHAPAKPTNVAPTTNATGVSKSPLLQASAFSDEDAQDVHTASQWLIRKVSDNSVVLDTGSDTENKVSFRPSNLSNLIEYEWQVRYKDAAGDWSEYSDATRFTTIGETVVEGSGLLGSYAQFNAKKGTVKVVGTRVDPQIAFNWKAGKSHPKAPANSFAVTWEGSVVSQASATYRFRVVADGGVKLWVGNNLIIDDWKTANFPVYRSGVATLEAGVPTAIRFEYFDINGNASVQLRWVSTSQPLQVIPTANLFPPTP